MSYGARYNIAQRRVCIVYIDRTQAVSGLPLSLTPGEAVTLAADLMESAAAVLYHALPEPEACPDPGLGPGETSPFEHGDGSTHTAAKLRQCNAELQASHDPEDGGW